jgi:hypothetical protein
MTDVLSLIPAAAMRKTNTGKFEPKLDFAERCAILAAYSNGVRRDVLATAFGVDRRTIGHIVNPTSVHYRDVRRKLKDDGPENFTNMFLTEELALKIGAAVKEEAKIEADPNAPNKKANKAQGLHTVKPSQCAYSHRIEIQWREAMPLNDGPPDNERGWYYRDLDSKEPNMWWHNGDDSRRTSVLALSYAEANLMDD